jgi:hypothetical protein
MYHNICGHIFHVPIKMTTASYNKGDEGSQKVLVSRIWKGCNRKPFKYFHIRRFDIRDHNNITKIVKIKPTKISDFTVIH